MMNDRASNMDVKKINRANTLRCIFACERISQPELAQKLGISWPTVLQNVKELLELGLVEEMGAYQSTGGRKARAFAPIKTARLALGLDITQNHIGMVLIDLSGELVQYTRRKKTFSTEDPYFREVGDALADFIEKSDCPNEKILGVGISLPGIVDESGQLLTYSHALELRNVPTSTFSSYIPYPCLFINDANAAGLAELRCQPTRRNTVYLSLSNSVGGAIFPDGILYTGDNLRAGEFGHNTLVPGGKPCYCGKQGCLDAYCSSKVLSDCVDGNLPLFFEEIRIGNTGLAAIWEQYLDDLAVVINNLRMSFDCDVIVGGYVGRFLEGYADQFRKKLIQRNTFEPDASYFKLCRYKLEAAATGAAIRQIEQFIREI